MAAKGLKHNESKYKDWMPAKLIEMFTVGKDREDFCGEHDISYTTFDIFLAKQPEFAEAYEIAKIKAKIWFNNIAREGLVYEPEGKRVDSKLWSMMMRNRFEMTEHRKLKLLGLDKAKNAVEQMKLVMAELAAGNLTGSEAQQVAKLIESGVTVYEATELEKRVAEIEKAGRIGVADDEFKEE